MDATIEVTYAGEHGTLPDPVDFDATDAQVRTWVTESLESGSIPGIPAQATVDLTDFVIDRYGPNDTRATGVIILRPKTPFGT